MGERKNWKEGRRGSRTRASRLVKDLVSWALFVPRRRVVGLLPRSWGPGPDVPTETGPQGGGGAPCDGDGVSTGEGDLSPLRVAGGAGGEGVKRVKIDMRREQRKNEERERGGREQERRREKERREQKNEGGGRGERGAMKRKRKD